MDQPASSSKPKRSAVLACSVLLVVASGVFADYWIAKPAGLQPTYVGRNACVTCHQEQAAAYAGSHHGLAMDLATDTTVLGDFDDATIEHDGLVSRMFRRDERFMVHTEGEDGQMQDFEVKYVFGYEPLQQYMVEFGRTDDMADDEIPRVQVLRITWDTEQKRWFYLRPPDVSDKLEPDDPLHWTGIAQRWQTMCADCHSTNLRRNFDTTTAQYHTTFSEIDVSCEACHGPGSLHVELANSKSVFWDRNHRYGLAELKGDDPEPQLQACAPCHSRRGVIDADYRAGDPFCDHFQLETLQEDTYFADGQIKDEVYVYGSFVQSRMYHKGIRCTDCHDPHSLKLKHTGNETCTSCHQHAAGKYDVPSHHHHKVGSEAAQCVSCHMPHRTYMDVDPRRDHSLRVPRPDLSVKLGTPNACSGCHVEDGLDSIDPEIQSELQEYADWLELAEAGNEQVADAIRATDQWCDEACQTWYGKDRKTPNHYGEVIAKYRAAAAKNELDRRSVEQMLRLAITPDELTPFIARATALQGLAETQQGWQSRQVRELVDNPNEHPMVRAAGINLYMSATPDVIRRTLLPHIDDPSRLVRTEAARVLVASGVYAQTLSGTDQLRVDKTLDEVHQSLMSASDRAGAHMAWGMLCERQNRGSDAIRAYETAMRIEPDMTGPRTNLAAVLERAAGGRSAPEQAAIAERVAQLRAEELVRWERDAALAPDNASVQYRFGLALYLAGRLQEALQRLERAVELEPHVRDFNFARDSLRGQLKQQ